MPLFDDIQYAFAAGELSPTLAGRQDLDKYDLGLEIARNWFIDYRGGLSNRPGTIFVDYVMFDHLPTKFFPFKFAPALESTYVMLFGHNYIRFIQDGAYILELAKPITGISSANPGVVTAVGHGYTNGDWVKIFDVVGPIELNQQTYRAVNVTANTFQLEDTFGNTINTAVMDAYVSGGNVYRIYTVPSPYAATDLETLRAHQSRSQITLTHPSYKPRALVRVSDTNWTLTQISFGNNLATPTGLTITPSAAGTAGVGFTVTAINAEGEESLPAQYVFNTVIVNYLVTSGASCKFTWTKVNGAVKYRVYRTQIVPQGTDLTRSQPIGLIGESFGPEFVDNNIIPDYSRTPPLFTNPFADGAIEFIEVTAGGSGYSRTSVVSASVGTGFIGQAIVNEAGTLLAIAVLKGGSGYTGATVISVTGGTGATVTVTLSPPSGNNPAVASVFQQRQVFAATLNNPLTVWGSKPALFNNFDVSSIVVANDSYGFELDSEEVAPIRHLLPARQGLVMFSQAGVWQLSSSDGVVRATDALADPQSYTGCSLVPPLVVDIDIVYIEGKGQTVRLMTWQDFSKLYQAQDLSILSSHLITPTNQIIAWTYAADPFKLIWAIREDGAMLTMTLNKEQNVYAWTQNWTKGLYLDVLAMQENQTDTVYLMTQRFINGRWTKYIEQVASRSFQHSEEAWFVDCGLANSVHTPATSLNIAAATGNDVLFTTAVPAFGPSNVGDIIRAGGGLAEITTYVDPSNVRCSIIRPITQLIPEDPSKTPLTVNPGFWSRDVPVSSVGGLGHLEGQTVRVLADGAVLPDKVVTNARIDLGVNATRIIVGLPYTSIAKALPANLPNAVIEDKKKKTVRTAVRLHESRGLKVGDDLEHLREFKERLDERYGEATKLQNGMKIKEVDSALAVDGSIYYVQDYPLPATILGWIHRLEVTENDR